MMGERQKSLFIIHVALLHQIVFGNVLFAGKSLMLVTHPIEEWLRTFLVRVRQSFFIAKLFIFFSRFGISLLLWNERDAAYVDYIFELNAILAYIYDVYTEDRGLSESQNGINALQKT